MQNQINRFIRDQEGQDLVEYSLLMILLGGVAILFMVAINSTVGAIFNKISTRLASGNAGTS
jgi:Flp pilus assembly pilin Flp